MIALALYAANPKIRERLGALADQDGIKIAGTIDDPSGLARFLDTTAVNVVLTELPAGIDVADWLSDRRAAYVVLVEEDDLGAARSALLAGASAVLPYNVTKRELRLAIEAAATSLRVVPQFLLGALLHFEQTELSEAAETPLDTALTPRELEVLAALADGASNKIIARRLGISFHTVKFHVAAILEKLDADSRTEALAEAARRGLVML